ncbi:histidine kinase [Paenibacillus sp. LHD-38]|uniref:sensor histidine kinase n=1 Tax=Paenibacillus sp. LHD-38 TaxID=3072143 RepID=UPI00280DD9FE|nr:histidine kinase [Paenibacillus sp. LHD-38]MDQ8736498.1 histidine kinase [Paenibacillus sp. LHD-38]
MNASDLKRKYSFNSIRMKLIFGVVILTFPLIAILIYYSVYSTEVVRNQVADSYKNMMILYMSQVDNALEDIDKYMNNTMVADSDFVSYQLANTDYDYYFSKILMSNKLSNDIGMFKAVDSFFLYAPKRDDLMRITQERSTVEEEEAIFAVIRQTANENTDPNRFNKKNWYVQKIEDTYYMMHIYKSGDVYFGAGIKAYELMVPFRTTDFGANGGALFAKRDGIPMTNVDLVNRNEVQLRSGMENYYLSGNQSRFLVVGESSAKGDFNLVALVPDEKILEKLPYLQIIVALIALACLISLPLGLYLLRRTVLLPLNQLMAAMKRLRGGNFEARIEAKRASDEFILVNETFNNMMTQIKELRIHVYEEQLSKQKEELLRLQLQINPHFFMNSLNVLYNLAKVGNVELMKGMSLSLIRYFKYMFRSNLSFVKLKEELEHTRNYFRIQEMRYPESLTCDIHAPEFLMDTNVPPLVIQTFVENAVKYAVTLDEPTNISIAIDVVELGGAPSMNIVIQDSGKGFPEEVLTVLQKGESLFTEEGEHVGIWNVQRRLRLLYDHDAHISFSNGSPRGAVIEITMPIHSKL